MDFINESWLVIISPFFIPIILFMIYGILNLISRLILQCCCNNSTHNENENEESNDLRTDYIELTNDDNNNNNSNDLNEPILQSHSIFNNNNQQNNNNKNIFHSILSSLSLPLSLWFYRCLFVIAFFLKRAYLPIITTSLSLLHCQTANIITLNTAMTSNPQYHSISYLTAKPWIICNNNNSRYEDIRIASIIVFVIYGILFPLITYGWAIRKEMQWNKEESINNSNINNKFNSERRRSEMHYVMSILLWPEFDDKTYWWSAIQLIRDLILAILVTQISIFR